MTAQIPPDVLQEMIAAHLEQKRQAGLSNFTEPVDANDIKNPNLHARLEWPSAVFHQTTGEERVAQTPEHLAKMGPDWSKTRPVLAKPKASKS